MINSILKQLHNANHIVLVSHKNPDGDTLGSALALSLHLRSINKRVSHYCPNEAAPYLQFLPDVHLVGPNASIFTDETVDLVVVLDSSDPHHAGVGDYVLNPQRTFRTIVIDHHATNDLYGDTNYVEANASSTCELVYNILNQANALSSNIATCLLTGIITDTGSFSNLATTATSIEAGSALLSAGADLPTITKHALHHRPYHTLKLWGKALERLHHDPKTGMVVTYITMDDIAEAGGDQEAAGGISNLLNSLEEAAEKAVLVLVQIAPDVIKGSLRTTNPLLDVSAFAKLHGGGGHKKAAGFTLNGTIQPQSYGYTIDTEFPKQFIAQPTASN